MELDRRNFLKGALATGAVAAAGAALTSCSPASSDSGSDGNVDSTTSGEAKHTWEVKPEPITDIAETKSYDIVIVGAGLAGISAAESAARSGAKVAVIERSTGISIRGVDVGNIGSNFHKSEGFDIDWHIPARQLHADSRQKTNYELISVWASRSGEVFDYLEKLGEPIGVSMTHALSGTAKYDGWDQLDGQWRVYPDAVSFVRGDETYDVRGDGKTVNWTLGEMFYDSAVENGAEFIFDTHAEQLVGDAESGITGVIASTKDGKNIQYDGAKAVILATGDIGGNQEMIDVFAPSPTAQTLTPTPPKAAIPATVSSWAAGQVPQSRRAPLPR